MSQTITLITGANQGIGRAVAIRLAKEHNHHVLIGCRTLANGEAVAQELQSAGHQATAVQLDVTSDASIDAALALIKDKFGRLDVLVNNAAQLLDPDNAFKDMPTLPTRELFERTYGTNVIGTACLTEAALPLLREAVGGPRVVFVSTIMSSLTLALDPNAFWYARDYKAYDSSKSAVNMLALNYARILKDVGGRVNLVCPGLVSTNAVGFTAMGSTPEVGAQRIVELATVGADGPNGTFSNKEGPIPW